MKALKCKPSTQFAYNYTINVLSKCSNIISHLSSILESQHEDRRWKHCTDNPTSHQILSTTALHKILRGIRITLDEGTHAHTYIIVNIRQQPHTCTNYVLYAYLYCVHALVGGVISIRDHYFCAILRVCANGLHAVFHRPVV